MAETMLELKMIVEIVVLHEDYRRCFGRSEAGGLGACLHEKKGGGFYAW